MKNINKSNIMGLIGMDIINIKNEEVGTVVGDFNGKYIVNVDGEEKFYSESTLIRNWKIVEEETEEVMSENNETEEVINEENIEDENKPNEVIEEETEETSNEEIITEEINDEDEIVDEIEEVINENNEVIKEEIEEVIDEENTEDENKANEDEIVEETEETSNEEIITEEIKDEDEIVDETEEVINENDEVIEEETEEVISETDETEEFVLETENEGIIDNIKETEGRVKITGHLYGIPVKFDKINQTTVWKTLIKLYDNRKDENDKYSLEDKKYLVRQLKQLDEKVFAGAFRCLVSKTKQNYIDELLK